MGEQREGGQREGGESRGKYLARSDTVLIASPPQPAEIVLWCNKHASHTTVSLTEIQGELVVQPCLLMALFSWHGVVVEEEVVN